MYSNGNPDNVNANVILLLGINKETKNSKTKQLAWVRGKSDLL